MSAKSAREFMERITTDQQFRETLSNELKHQTDPAAVITSLASKNDYSFTASEIGEVLRVYKSEEMTEAELQSVAGGGLTVQADATILRTLQLIYQPRPTSPGIIRGGIEPTPF